MTEDNEWQRIIKYHCIPTIFTGVFWLPSKDKNIHIYNLVKKYEVVHKYIREHEKRHYNNSRQNLVIRYFKDVYNDIKSDWDKPFNKELKKNYEKYKNKLYGKNNAIVTNVNLLMEKLHEQKPTLKMEIYSKLVFYGRIAFWIIIIFGIPIAIFSMIIAGIDRISCPK